MNRYGLNRSPTSNLSWDVIGELNFQEPLVVVLAIVAAECIHFLGNVVAHAPR